MVRNQRSGQLRLLPSAERYMRTGQEAVAVLCGWEGNRRSGVTPVMRHRIRGLSTYGLNGVEELDIHGA